MPLAKKSNKPKTSSLLLIQILSVILVRCRYLAIYVGSLANIYLP